MQEDLDPFEMMEAVNIIDRLPGDFFDKIVSFLLIDCLFIRFDLFIQGIKTMERSKRSTR